MINTIKSQYEILCRKCDNTILKFFPNKQIGWKVDLKIAFLAKIEIFQNFALFCKEFQYLGGCLAFFFRFFPDRCFIGLF